MDVCMSKSSGMKMKSANKKSSNTGGIFSGLASMFSKGQAKPKPVTMKEQLKQARKNSPNKMMELGCAMDNA